MLYTRKASFFYIAHPKKLNSLFFQIRGFDKTCRISSKLTFYRQRAFANMEEAE